MIGIRGVLRRVVDPAARDNGGDNKTVGPGGATNTVLRGLTLSREG